MRSSEVTTKTRRDTKTTKKKVQGLEYDLAVSVVQGGHCDTLNIPLPAL